MKVDLMIIGAMKCGTTTLADLLKDHPQVSFCTTKEPEFFSKDPDWRAHLDSYHALFPSKENALYAEASTGYTFYPHFNRALWEDLHTYNPQLRFIYVVRDPIDRIVSHYMHIHERGYTDKELQEAVRMIPLLVNLCRYHAQVLPFIERFGRERVLIITFDDLMQQRMDTLDRVARFCGIDVNGFPYVDLHSNPSIGGRKTLHWADAPPRWARWMWTLTPKPMRQRVWKRITHDPARSFLVRPELDPSWKEAVIRLLESDILQLEQLMGRSFTAWWERAGLARPEQRLPAR